MARSKYCDITITHGQVELVILTNRFDFDFRIFGVVKYPTEQYSKNVRWESSPHLGVVSVIEMRVGNRFGSIITNLFRGIVLLPRLFRF